LDFFSIEFKRVFREFESLLDEGSEFTNATALLSKNFLGVRSTDDNLIILSISEFVSLATEM
jgi:hypothetical protein